MSNTPGNIETNVTSSLIEHFTNITSIARQLTTPVYDVNTTSAHVYEDTTNTPDTVSQEVNTAPCQDDTYDTLDYVDYMYQTYSFERPVYLYIWEILVILTSIVNIVVVSILLRRKMRNPTNIILAAIAISDSLTGLTTLPTYLMVYQSTDPSGVDVVAQTMYQNSTCSYYMDSHGHNIHPEVYPNHSNNTHLDAVSDNGVEGVDGFNLSKDLCRWFMATKFFISKMFHSISIYLTLFLGIQRFVSVAIPFQAHALTTQRSILICIIIAVLSPLLHVYHLMDEKAKHGMCEWDLDETGCTGGCIELWIMFVIRNVIPCGVLLLFTILFIRELRKGEVSIRKMNSSRGQIARRVIENRRIAFIVTAIVIVFLIPEIPYGFYLFYNAIDKTAYNGVHMDLESNRAVHMTYELLLVLSFHANFYIYTLFNRKFRRFLITLFVQPVRRMLGDNRRASISTIPSQRKTELMSSKSKLSTLKTTTPSNTLSKTAVESTAFMKSVSVDITQTSHQNKDNELEASNANV